MRLVKALPPGPGCAPAGKFRVCSLVFYPGTASVRVQYLMKISSCPGPARIEPLETRIAPAFVTGVLDLSSLSGGNGSQFSGGTAGDLVGQSVASAGDEPKTGST